MPTRLFNVFDAYDFHGKSLPGMTFLLGLFTLLPSGVLSLFINTERSLAESFITFVMLIASVVLVGTLIGEGVHTIAVLSEKVLDWVGRRVTNTRNFLYLAFPELKSAIQDGSRSQWSEANKIKAIRTRPWVVIWRNWTRRTLDWVIKRVQGIRYVLIGHRRVFEQTLMDPGQDPSEPLEDIVEDLNFHQEFFLRTSLYDFDVDPDNLGAAYPVVSSILSENQFNRAVKFQAKYAFCRGMWVSALVMACAYATVFVLPRSTIEQFIGYTPMIADVSGPIQALLLVGLIGTTLTFMNSAGRYKQYYVEYLTAEFYAVARSEDGFSADPPEPDELSTTDNPRQTTFEHWGRR